MKQTTSATSSDGSRPPVTSDDPAVLAAQARETLTKNAAEIRKQQIAIATEPPTTYRP